MSFKVVFIGAGSIGFTRKIVQDLLGVPEFRDIEIAFTDINPENLDMVTQLCQRDIDHNGLPIKIQSTLDRREALRNARYVLTVVRVGGLDAFQHDVDIPMKYGVDQCVGDTLCAGGLMYAQRGIPVMLDICQDLLEVGEPGAMIFNYANPMAMMTWAANTYGGVQTIGLCHGVQNGHKLMAEAYGLPQEEIDIICAGINHQTWYLDIKHKGEDIRGDLLKALEAHPRISEEEKVRIDVLKRFGYFSTESNGHLSEYLPWYRKRASELNDWISLDKWIHGESGGYLRVCTEGRNWFKTDFPYWMSEPPAPYSPNNRGIEHGSYIIEGLETGRVYRGHFNVPNNGIISNLPDDAIIEAPGYVDRNGISMPTVGDLPLGCAAICQQSVDVQRLGVLAAVNGDDELLRQAMILDPLVGAVCTPPEAWQMTDEMLVALADWMPQYKEAIVGAKERLADAENLLPTKDGYKGAARLKTRSVEELAEDKESIRALATKHDKG
ncbi:alpha-glucosidase/alpha-galactosidase [Pelagicoccus mobilis]|uniref:Alpha-glucosidase/alpha-galactosidase n=1 Tax=Pelagicoccus mobilis TaxID=415221 RepID=A0A934S5I7_9BACT|nr:alpha-glucosidase/alpha-galactosidase [Pelagicoccus mobilis]MBK1879333.1 alpha-glucosidase/alpha-galactosidase [Pelagicoccus mobilis]